MDDHVLNRVFLQVAQHLHQLGSIGSLGALAAINELRFDARPECLGFTMAGRALRGYREALGLSAHFGLLPGRDPNVYQCPGLDIDVLGFTFWCD
ncbi:MAG: hypothetical protein M1337_01710 [Actinobacteria bacterium]|nr:hypothetical protein [Actinomycetota bacterium]